MTWMRWLDGALWAAGAGHFLLLAAGLQVPYRMRWKEDLAKLQPMNRKLMWTYATFIVFVIVAFGALTLLLHDELIRGDRAARGLAIFIASFWTLRLIFDLWFSHEDWPSGRRFVVGHVLLDLLFVFLAATYWVTGMWGR